MAVLSKNQILEKIKNKELLFSPSANIRLIFGSVSLS